MMKRSVFSVMLMAVPLWTSIGHAATPPESFAREIVKAIQSRNTEQRMAVLHSKSRACIDSMTRPYYDWIFTRQFRYQLPDRFKVTSSPFSGPTGPLPDKSAYPVKPTHQVQIDFALSPTRNMSIVVLARNDGNRWFEVLPCPSPETLAGAKRSSAERDRQNRRIQELAARVTEPLRSELMSLIKAGRRIDAIRKYADTTGEELVIAKGVVEVMEKGK